MSKDRCFVKKRDHALLLKSPQLLFKLRGDQRGDTEELFHFRLTQLDDCVENYLPDFLSLPFAPLLRENTLYANLGRKVDWAEEFARAIAESRTGADAIAR